MVATKISIDINELKPGMILAKEIEFEGRVLLAAGIAITEATINKLKNQYILNKIDIYSKEKNLYDDMLIKNEKTIEEIEESFKKLSFSMQEIFDNIHSIKINGIEEVRIFSQRIQEELKSTSLVVKNIVLNGSGEDVIYRHSVNVAALSAMLGKWIGLDENKINLLTYSAILHDFGKTKIDEKILNKVQPLRESEFKQIKRHTITAYNYIKEIAFLDNSVSYGVLMHTEREDGSGYPLGIKYDKIHKFAKIIAIADVFDAINSNRVYRKKRNPLEALEIIKKESLGKLDYEYCNIFLSNIVNYYMGERVLLNNKKIGKIIQIDLNNISKPLLLTDDGFLDLKKEKNVYVENLIL